MDEKPNLSNGTEGLRDFPRAFAFALLDDTRTIRLDRLRRMDEHLSGSVNPCPGSWRKTCAASIGL